MIHFTPTFTWKIPRIRRLFQFLPQTLTAFAVFWLYRSQIFAGDGGLIARITEGGKWIVKNELLSQAILQLGYRILSIWNYPPLETMNVVSCFAGAISLGILFRFAYELYRIPWQLPLLLYFSSGFFIYACGHTEYYPLLLPALWWYGYSAIRYVRNQTSIWTPTFAFLIATALHFVMLFALPSLIVLPFLAKRPRHLRKVLLGLAALIPLVVIRNYPEFLGYRAATLSPAWNVLPWFPYTGMYQHYAFFQWGHWIDWGYAWYRRSWIFWPLIIWAVYIRSHKKKLLNLFPPQRLGRVRVGLKHYNNQPPLNLPQSLGEKLMSPLINKIGSNLLYNPEHSFLWLYTLCFSVWTAIWHPDLGMEADWDLFAVEAAPCLLLLIYYLPSWLQNSFRRSLLLLLTSASIVINFSFIQWQADFPRRGFGSVEVHVPPFIQYTFTLEGINRSLIIPHLREGTYEGKLIDQTNRQVQNFSMVVVADRTTKFAYPSRFLQNSKSNVKFLPPKIGGS